MNFNITYTYPHKHILEVELTIDNVTGDFVELQLPAWRPGRYELQNYAKNVFKVTAKDSAGNSLPMQKKNKNLWKADIKGNSKLVVSYSYFAKQMDAGGSWLDENQWYVNFINCLMYVKGREGLPCKVKLNLPDDYILACGLGNSKLLAARHFYQLADSPFIASKSLKSHTFSISGSSFAIHIQGNCSPEWLKIEHDFSAFIRQQIGLFGEFPEKDYHFLFQILPYKHYHGVEHANSTVITLGPDIDFDNDQFYKQLLGISSHELFHAWNICKIRPAEMLPYDLTRENYFPTGFIAEGVTTYYGDLMLARADVWSADTYFEAFSDNLQQHMQNPGRNFASLVESSLDLWVDGYQASHPFRKVSIYDKGALVAFILDMEIRGATSGQRSLDDLMRLLWQQFGKEGKGYLITDYQSAAESIAGVSFARYFEEYIYGTAPLERILARCFDYVGCVIQIYNPDNSWEGQFGFKVKQKNDGAWIIDAIEPGSPADKVLDKEDEILEINGQQVTGDFGKLTEDKQMMELTIVRTGQVIKRAILKDGGSYFKNYRIKKNNVVTEIQKLCFKQWLNQEFFPLTSLT